MNQLLSEWFDECLRSYLPLRAIRWTHARRRKAIEIVLRARPHASDRSLAAETGFSRVLIAETRKRLPAYARPRIRIGVDGKRYEVRGAGP